ncbi:Signal transduction histidine kinase [Paractinoplanes atraurantiacus]|uniref:histidine kinase n=1 Tax=Paractinoplanes atraurantiacus TaxID=1036182 RepID=A0A285IZM7_9ACTN|nr:Signal transduction histidine kinase [Actinoplanes atraurantiacus]
MAIDAAPAVVVAAVTVPQLRYHAAHDDPQFGAYVLFSVLLVVPLVWRRRFPLWTFAFAAVVALTQWAADVRLAADLALLVYLYTVASRHPMRVAIVAAGVVEVGAVLAAVRWPESGSWAGTGSWAETFLLLSGPVVAALLLGVTARQRREALSAAVQRAAVAERTRIAAEMHDIIAHSLAVMVTLSEGAVRKQAREPQRAGEAMRQVAATGRQALTETRRLLGLLHEAPALDDRLPQPYPVQPRHPQPGLAQLGDLLDQVRSTGLTVESAVTDTADGMPPGAELAVYRIVQEALTNTLKHAIAPCRISVTVTRGPTSVTVDVHDDGASPSARASERISEHAAERTTSRPSERASDGVEGRTKGGHGIVGMRERAAVYAGTVTAGPDPRGGWRVHADLVLPAEAAAR